MKVAGSPDPMAAPEPADPIVWGQAYDIHHIPRPFDSEEQRRRPDSWVRRHLLAICLAVFCTAGAAWVVQQVGIKGLMGFAPQGQSARISAGDAKDLAVFQPIVQHIYDVTNRAFLQRDPALLSQVYTSDCQCMSEAEHVINQLRAANVRLGGNGTTLVSVEILEVSSRVALLSVTDRIAPYVTYNAQGQVVGPASKGRIPTVFTMDLVKRDGIWKVSDVVQQDNTLP
jgi:hypothetical protein